MHTLQERKSEIMKHLDISNDEYNELIKISFGILGTETEFSEDGFYKFKETNSFIGIIKSGVTAKNLNKPGA